MTIHKFSLLALGLFSCFIFFGCPQKGGNCEHMGTIKDFTGLDGCKMLIVMDNGEKLQPVKVDPKLTFKDGQRISFSYLPVSGMASICMSGKMVEITCFNLLDEQTDSGYDNGDPNDICKNLPEDVMKVEWMKNILSRSRDIDQVRTFEYQNANAYFFKVSKCCDFQSFVYDCKGNKLCTDGGFTGGDCHGGVLSGISKDKMKLIWSKPGTINK